MNMVRRKISLRVVDTGEQMEYKAVVKGDGGKLEISGSTYCDTKECIKQIIKRALTGRRAPPEDVEKAARHIVDYLLASIKLFRTDNASASLWLNIGIEAELGISASLYYLDDGEAEDEEEYVGWVAEVSARFSGCDGAAAVDSLHEFKKELTLGRYLDDAAVKKLTDELIGLAKLAYNILLAG